MEGVIGLLFLLLLLLLAMTPVIILLGAIGLAFETILAAIPFALKYFLPPALIGLAVARIRDKERMGDLRDYAPTAAGFVAAAAVLLLIVLNVPVHPTFPQTDQIVSITASYTEITDETVTETTEDRDRIRILCDSLTGKSFTRSVKEFSYPEEDARQYTVVFTDKDGNKTTVLFCNRRTVAIKKGIFTYYYKTDKDSSVSTDAVEEIFWDAHEARIYADWNAFTDEFFESFRFVWSETVPGQGYLSFTVPDLIPEASYYSIRIYMNGMENYNGGEFVSQPFYIYEDEQHKDQWVCGKTYEFWVTDTCYDRFEIVVEAPWKFTRTLDILPLLPEECVKN